MTEQWIVLFWDLPRLRILRGERRGERWCLLSLEDLLVPESLTLPNAGRGIAEWLRQESPAYCFSSDDAENLVHAAIVLPRDRVTIRALSFPNLPPEELPSVVPLQMALQLTTRAEDLVVDFLPGERNSAAEPQQVLAAAIPLVSLQNFQQFASSLHVHLGSVGVSSCGWQELARQLGQVPEAQGLLVSCFEPDHLESLWLRGEYLIGSGYRRRSAESPLASKELLAEIRRLQSQEAGGATQHATQCLLLAELPTSDGTLKHRMLVEEFSKAISLPVFLADWDALSTRLEFSPSTGLARASELSARGGLGLLGAWMAAATPLTPQVNFAAPRKPRLIPDRRRMYALSGGLAAVLLLGLAWWAWYQQLQTLDGEIDSVRSQLASVETFLKDKGILRKQASGLDAQRARSLRISAHWEDLARSMPPQSELMFNSWRAIPLTGDNHTRVLARGLATTRRQVELLAEKLDGVGLIVRSPVIRPLEMAGPYAFEFDLDYEIPVAPREIPGSAQAVPASTSPSKAG